MSAPSPAGSRPDVLIVGAGGSGAALAARLSEDTALRVLVLEAGPVGAFSPDLLDARLIPGAQPHNQAVRRYPVLLAADRPYVVPRGRILGGSTTVNGGYFVRARAADFADWAAAAGDPRWEYAAALPAMEALESDLDLGRGSGPVPVRRTTLSHPAAAAFQAAARELGHPDEPDKNAQGVPGFGPVPSNVVGGRRVNTGLAYVSAAAGRPNLRVLGGHAVRSVVVERGRAAGVLTEHDGRREVIRAGEVVLCAGAFGSAHLLHLSGIGPAGDLRRAGIPVVADLPAVGAAFGDHPQIAFEWRPREPLPEPAGTWLGGALHLGPDGGDLEILQSLVPLAGLLAGVPAVAGAPLPFLVSVLAPSSEGRLRTVSADPDVPPYVHYGYLRTADGRRRLREAVRAAAGITATAAFREVSAGPAGPEPPDGDGALDAWIRERLGTAQHTCGTVPMGDAADGTGRVHGVSGLRVADTSILPAAPRRGPAATAVLIGELAARAIRAG